VLLLHLQIDGPDHQVVGRLLAHQLKVILQEALGVVVLAQHAVLLAELLVLLDELLHALLALLLGQILVRLAAGLLVDHGLFEAGLADGIHVPGRLLLLLKHFALDAVQLLALGLDLLELFLWNRN